VLHFITTSFGFLSTSVTERIPQRGPFHSYFEKALTKHVCQLDLVRGLFYNERDADVRARKALLAEVNQLNFRNPRVCFQNHAEDDQIIQNPSAPRYDPPLLAKPIKRLSMETIAIVLDVVLVIAAIAAYLARPRIGGQLSKGLQTLMTGILVLGLAHLIETLFFTLLFVDRPLNEVIHRLLVAVGFIFVIVGFVRMRKAFDGEA
jgi:hypothetical protein